jgi:hypothetical protein
VQEEAVLSYAKIIPIIQVLRAETEKGGSYGIYGNPRRVVWFCRKMTTCFEGLCNGFFKTYALIPC